MAYYTGLHDIALKRRILQMMQQLRSGTISHNDFDTFLSSLGSILSSLAETSMPPFTAHDAGRFKSSQGKIDSSSTSISLLITQVRMSDIVKIRVNLQEATISAQTPVNYDGSRSTNPYVNGSRLIQGGKVRLICGNSGYLAVRGGVNCPPGAKKLELIEAVILRSLLFLNDRNVESNIGLIKSRYFDDSDPVYNMESNMFHLNYHSDESSEVPHIKSYVLMGGLDQVDVDVFAYEPAGQKRARIDDDSEDDSYRVRRAAEANECERHKRRERHRHQKNSKGNKNVVLPTPNHEKR
ncbi:hypothetical protein HI914_03994 [Erysiphe necator]|nr:hypothetical protein HI914_03994 [Erysiphe necator]